MNALHADHVALYAATCAACATSAAYITKNPEAYAKYAARYVTWCMEEKNMCGMKQDEDGRYYIWDEINQHKHYLDEPVKLTYIPGRLLYAKFDHLVRA